MRTYLNSLSIRQHAVAVGVRNLKSGSKLIFIVPSPSDITSADTERTIVIHAVTTCTQNIVATCTNIYTARGETQLLRVRQQGRLGLQGEV